MILVAFIAADFAAVRAMLDVQTITRVLLVLGGLPMANVLAAGFLVARRHPRSRTFFQGFVVVGTAALIFFVVAAVGFPDTVADYYTWVAIPVLQAWTLRLPPGLLSISINACSVVLVLGGPQFVSALFGGLFHQRYRIVRRANLISDDARPIATEASAARPA
jgi:hypothetical protein